MQTLQKEKEFLNFYVSGHPLDRFQDEIRGFATLSLAPESLARSGTGLIVTVGGIVTTVKQHVQRNGKPMAFLTMEDFDGTVELLVFGDAYEKYRDLLVEDAMVLAHGTVTRREGEESPKIRLDNCLALAEARKRLARSVHVRLNTVGLEKEFPRNHSRPVRKNCGPCAIILHLVTAEGNEYRMRSRSVTDFASAEAIKELREQVGRENVWIGKSAA